MIYMRKGNRYTSLNDEATTAKAVLEAKGWVVIPEKEYRKAMRGCLPITDPQEGNESKMPTSGTFKL